MAFARSLREGIVLSGQVFIACAPPQSGALNACAIALKYYGNQQDRLLFQPLIAAGMPRRKARIFS
jgi:hypothetical protein